MSSWDTSQGISIQTIPKVKSHLYVYIDIDIDIDIDMMAEIPMVTLHASILFVTGYDTMNNRTYGNLSEYLPPTDFFYYQGDQILCQIVKRLVDQYNHGSYTILMCHSAGAILLTQAKPFFKRPPQQVICLMPFVSINTVKMTLLALLPDRLCDYICLPNWITIPSYTLKSTFCFRDLIHSLKMRFLGHLKDLTDHVTPSLWENFLQLCRDWETTVIYGIHESLVPLSLEEQQILQDLCHFIPFDSRHEPFNDITDTQERLKAQLLSILSHEHH